MMINFLSVDAFGVRSSILSASMMVSMLVLLLAFPAEAAKRLNGFRLEPASIPVSKVKSGGPGRDGIPALTAPRTERAFGSGWPADEPVIGVVRNGKARAYPLSILVWHELVNDVLGGEPILVSYCPLCGTGIVFDRQIGGRAVEFGVSGLLYQSDVLMFDRDTDSLWSQIAAKAVVGPRMGEALKIVRSRNVPWVEWRRLHPETDVLSPDTGYQRSYGHSPYGDYAKSRKLFFPVRKDKRYHPKMLTLGLRSESGEARAYPIVEIRELGGCVKEQFAGVDVRIKVDEKKDVFDVDVDDAVDVIEGYWFAWAAFHPTTSVFRAREAGDLASCASGS